jgi:hypothetical protein
MSFGAKPRAMPKNRLIPDEHSEQVALVQWLRIKKIRHNATPNGSKRHIITAMKLKAEGVSAGFPDITVYLPNTTLYIEMKRQKGGTVSEAQSEWIEFLNTRPNSKAVVCNGASEAIAEINKILELKC